MKYLLIFTSIRSAVSLTTSELKLHLEFNDGKCYVKREACMPSLEAETNWRLLEFLMLCEELTVKCEGFLLCVLD